MISHDYFYRKLKSSDFIHDNSFEQKVILPVRFKNEFLSENIFFCQKEKCWKKIDISDTEIEKSGKDNVIYCEFPEEAVYPKNNYSAELAAEDGFHAIYSRLEIEEMNAEMISFYYDYKKNLYRYKVNQKYQNDSNNLDKNVFLYSVITDEEKLTLDFQVRSFEEKGEGGKDLAKNIPWVKNCNYVFDIKNGSFIMGVNGKFVKEEENNDDTNGSFSKFEEISIFFEKENIPENVLEFLYEKITRLAEVFAKRKLNFTKKEKPSIFDIYLVTKLPYEPNLFPLICKKEFNEIKQVKKLNRKDSEILKHFLKASGIKNCATVRRAYQKNPNLLFTCLKIKQAGFNDINLYERVLENKDYAEIFDKCAPENLKFFCEYSFPLRGELCTMKTLLKAKNKGDWWYVKDGLSMFRQYFNFIPEQLKKDILYDGFSEFNHDALENFGFKSSNKKISFNYTKEQKMLEDVIDGYKFLLPKDSFEMYDIGTILHNCVASYANQVKEKNCTIVYVKKEEEPVLCIEVRKTSIWQEKAKHNNKPNKEEADVLLKWHLRHGLKGI